MPSRFFTKERNPWLNLEWKKTLQKSLTKSSIFRHTKCKCSYLWLVDLLPGAWCFWCFAMVLWYHRLHKFPNNLSEILSVPTTQPNWLILDFFFSLWLLSSLLWNNSYNSTLSCNICTYNLRMLKDSPLVPANLLPAGKGINWCRWIAVLVRKCSTSNSSPNLRPLAWHHRLVRL